MRRGPAELMEAEAESEWSLEDQEAGSWDGSGTRTRIRWGAVQAREPGGRHKEMRKWLRDRQADGQAGRQAGVLGHTQDYSDGRSSETGSADGLQVAGVLQHREEPLKHSHVNGSQLLLETLTHKYTFFCRIFWLRVSPGCRSTAAEGPPAPAGRTSRTGCGRTMAAT